MSMLSRTYFHDEAAAFAHVEAVLWPEGPVCPHCGCTGRISKVKPNPERRVRFGLHRCGDCKKQFTVTVGTVFEASKVPLHKWLQAVWLMTASKKGVSSHQLHRGLEVTYKTAWFMSHRIREAMRSGDLAPFGGNGGMVEADETFIGREPGEKGRKPKGARAYHHKMKVLSLVDRNSGAARSFVVDRVDSETLMPIVKENIAKEATLMTDEGIWYSPIGREFADHQTVHHSKDEYVRGDAHTNTVEGYYSIFKRGMKGIYQHCGKQHLHRYLAEFDFRYSNRVAKGVDDKARADLALLGIVGKRLKYERPDPVRAGGL
jgi:transposase-like protein